MRYFLILLLSIQVFLLRGQTLKLSGIVSDEMGNPVYGVNIYLSGAGKTGTTSASGGTFHIECKPTDTLIFSHIAYNTRRLPVNLALEAPDISSLHIVLYSRPVSLEPVTIAEKADHRFRYLLDFETLGTDVLKLEILGRDKYLSLYSNKDKLFWKCLLPQYLNDCNHLGKDFLTNIYLHSDDTLYQLVADTSVCRILPGISRHTYQYIMDPCIGSLSNGILVKRYGAYQQSVTLVITNKSNRKVVYSQEDVLARMHLNDLDNIGPVHAGLGFDVAQPERMKEHPASLSKKFTLRGSGLGAASRGISKPISVESFCLNDTIYIFDHFIKKLFIFNKEGYLILSETIGYSNKEFMQKYLIDDKDQCCYGVFKNKRGIYLLPIDYRTARVMGPGKPLDLQFFEKVRIVKGTALYLKYNHVANERRIVKSSL